MTETFGFAIRAFGCAIGAAADSQESISILDRYIFPSLPRIEGGATVPDISLRVARSGDVFSLSVNGEFAASAPQPVGLVPDIVHAIDEAVVKRLSTLRAVHAGTVLWDGRALLLPGATHSGKSSMVAELLQRGATYFSDEYALIDAEGRVHPYPRPLLVREGSREQVPVLAGELNAPVGDSPAPVGWIALLEYKAGESWKVTPMEQSLAVVALLQNTPHELAGAPQMVQQFERAVAGASCYAGRRGDAAHAAGEILRLIGHA